MTNYYTLGVALQYTVRFCNVFFLRFNFFLIEKYTSIIEIRCMIFILDVGLYIRSFFKVMFSIRTHAIVWGIG